MSAKVRRGVSRGADVDYDYCERVESREREWATGRRGTQSRLSRQAALIKDPQRKHQAAAQSEFTVPSKISSPKRVARTVYFTILLLINALGSSTSHVGSK